MGALPTLGNDDGTLEPVAMSIWPRRYGMTLGALFRGRGTARPLAGPTGKPLA